MSAVQQREFPQKTEAKHRSAYKQIKMSIFGMQYTGLFSALFPLD